jgi:hypothetical protein
MTHFIEKNSQIIGRQKDNFLTVVSLFAACTALTATRWMYKGNSLFFLNPIRFKLFQRIAGLF